MWVGTVFLPYALRFSLLVLWFSSLQKKFSVNQLKKSLSQKCHCKWSLISFYFQKNGYETFILKIVKWSFNEVQWSDKRVLNSSHPPITIFHCFSRHDLSSLRILGTVGEPINPEAWLWYYHVVGHEKCSIVDTYWQTETVSVYFNYLYTLGLRWKKVGIDQIG